MKSIWLAILCSFFAMAVHAEAASAHLSARLISEVNSVVPSSSFTAAIEVKIEKGWHVYWQNAGDYGDAPTLTWKTHDGFEPSSFFWPVPKRIQVGTIVSFAYEDEVLFPFTVTPNASLAKDSITLEPVFKWLVCNKAMCVPGHASLQLKLPVSQSGVVANLESKAKIDVIKTMLPVPAPQTFKLSGQLTKDDFILYLNDLPPHRDEIGFFPIDPDDVNYAGASEIKKNGNGFEVKLKRSDRLINAVEHFPALLVLHSPEGQDLSYTVDIPFQANGASFGKILLPLLFAFLGGLLLNLMPCVFPVLSIKAMSVLKMSGEHQRDVKKMGWAYTFGILASFWLLVGILIFLRLGGQQVGWGFQLQSPQFVFVLACVLFVFGLNLLGFFEFSGRYMNMGDSLTQKSGWLGSFFTGVLATIVATPCSAPFMGSAVGFALSQSSFVIFLIFTALGLGLALPYLLICYLPGLGKVLPKPGAWMETFQQLMAFFIFGTVLWLAWVLSLQVSPLGLVLLLGAFIAIGFSVWIFLRFKKIALLAPIFGLIAVTALTFSLQKATGISEALAQSQNPNDLNWEKFSPEKVSDYQTKGRPVFVDFTAAWCVSCQFNETIVFHSDEVKQKLKSLNFVLLKADWTNQDPVITKSLQAFGRDGVPLYLIYPKGKDAPAVQLPEVINAGIVLSELEKLK